MIKEFFNKSTNLVGTLLCAIPSFFGALGVLINGSSLMWAMCTAFGVSILFGMLFQAFTSKTDNDGDALFIGVGTVISMVLTAITSLII